MKKTIVIHFYIKNDLNYLRCINSHFYFYEKYASLFNDVIFVIAPEDKNDIDFINFIVSKVLYTFRNNNLTIKIVDNDPLHEALTFYNEILMNEKLNGLVFFCHSKGGRYLVENTLKWITCMYHYNLNYFYDVISKIYANNGIFYGSFLHYSDDEFFNKYSAWYAGTFYWVNIEHLRRYLNDNNITINQITDGFFAEKLPGELFPKEKLDSLFSVKFNCKDTDGYFGDYNEYVEKMGFPENF